MLQKSLVGQSEEQRRIAALEQQVELCVHFTENGPSVTQAQMCIQQQEMFIPNEMRSYQLTTFAFKCN